MCVNRYLGQLKSYVQNKARSEGSIAKGYLTQEILNFCSRYIDDMETRWNQSRRVDDGSIALELKSYVDELFPQLGKPVGGYSYFNLTSIEKLQAHRHMLTNCSIVQSYLQ